MTFKHDPFGRRIQQAGLLGTTNYLYDGDSLVEEVNSGGAVVVLYAQTKRVDEPLAVLRAEVPSYYQEDALGSITSLSNIAGQLAQTYSFDSFGNQAASGGSLTNAFVYTGREFDSEANLYYYRAGFYDATIGRFISEDPSRFDGGINYYAYAADSPITFSDPFGLKVYPRNFVGPLQPGDVHAYIVDLNQKELAPLTRGGRAKAFYGDGECVSFTRHFAPALPCTRCWRAGPRVVDTDVPLGTAIATFDENGRYPGEDRNSGLFAGYTLGSDYSTGIVIIDQFPNPPHTAQMRPLPYANNSAQEFRSNSASAYFVITAPPGTTPGGCDCQ